LHTSSHLTEDTLSSHAESTSSTVLYLLLSLLSLPSSSLAHAASHLGIAQTFSTLLRALPFHVKQGRLIIPAEVTAKHGVVQEDVFRRGPSAHGIEDAVFEFATTANDQLATARNMLVTTEVASGRVPREAMPVFLAAVRIMVISTLRWLIHFPFRSQCQDTSEA
jgi:NADH dehydrogenase [ubiquinone] 1 alpha subcomplex assembly factor 6